MDAAKREVASFCEQLTQDLDYHRELLLAVHNKKNQASLESILVKQFVLSLGVAWEAFVNDLLLAYVCMNPGRALLSLKQRVSKSIVDKYGASAGRLFKAKLPSSLSRDQAILLLDHKQWNLTARSAQDLASRANELLDARHARLFSLGIDDSALIDFIIALRNYLSHNSAASRRTLAQQVLKLTGAPNLDLAGSIRHLGPYLKASTQGNSRAERIVFRALEVAGKLA